MFRMTVLRLNRINMLVNVYFSFINLCGLLISEALIKKNYAAISSNPPIYISTITYWEQIIGANH